MKLTMPEPKINLYTDGFDGICKLNREVDGKKLSDLVERIGDPLVIALDAPWGAGKSVFLKCWVGAHTLENKGTATTVYFDAFKNDYMDDPLVGLTAAISERFELKGTSNSTLTKVKQVVSKLAKPTARVALALGTAGMSELTGAVVDVALDAGSKELAKASEEFWKKEDGKRAAMAEFRGALTELATEQKIVIVVDELDRCRPDYALNLLEVIKHFFDVPNVHFVLGVNLKELENSVRARYGSGVNAALYLQKFITLTMNLAKQPTKNQQLTNYFDELVRDHPRSMVGTFDIAKVYIQSNEQQEKLTLRGIQHFIRLLTISPSAWRHRDEFEIGKRREILQVGLCFLCSFYPEALKTFPHDPLTFEIVSKFLGLEIPTQDTHASELNSKKSQTALAWMHCFPTEANINTLEAYHRDSLSYMCSNINYSTLEDIWRTSLQVFEVQS